jgi:hypothetical protein
VDKKEFWSLIEKSQKFENQAEWLIDELIQKGIDSILEFEFLFQGLLNESYQSRLWGAAYVLMGGCSDDAFDYFRGWLIGQGEEIYNKVMHNPEYLAEYIGDENLDEEGFPQNEELLTVGSDAYTLIKTGVTDWDDDIYDELLEEIEKKGLKPLEEIEFDWEEDDLDELFPKLWERFGENPLG